MATTWVSLAEAAAAEGVSVRTLQRRVQAGELASKVEQGRRLVEIKLADTRDNMADTAREIRGDDVAELADTLSDTTIQQAQHQAAALSVMADRVSSLAEGRLADVQAELTRTRRAARWGWSVAAAAVIVLTVGTAWSVRAIELARGQAATAEAVRAVVVEQSQHDRQAAERARARADELAGELIRVRQAQAMTAAAELVQQIP